MSSVLSGNRNFEGRVHPLTKANYLASPPLCVIYALAGTVDLDINKDPISHDKNGNPVYMKDLWPSNDEVQSFVKEHIKKEMFLENYKDISKSNERWNALPVSNTVTYPWDPECTYIH